MPNKPIQELIDSQLSKEQDARAGRVRSGLWSPSLLGRCYRAQYYNRFNAPASNPFDLTSLRKLKAGKLFHDFVQNIVVQADPSIQTEVLLTTDNAKGYADLVNGNEVIDLKSQHSRKFWHNQRQIKAGKKIEDMFYPNWMQVMFYAQVLGKEYARLVFISKDDLTIQEYKLPLDGYWKGELDMEFTKLEYYWKQRLIPPASPRCFKDESGKSKECDYCQWKDLCLKMKEDSVKESVGFAENKPQQTS
jgi:hypothetical protein